MNQIESPSNNLSNIIAELNNQDLVTENRCDLLENFLSVKVADYNKILMCDSYNLRFLVWENIGELITRGNPISKTQAYFFAICCDCVDYFYNECKHISNILSRHGENIEVLNEAFIVMERRVLNFELFVRNVEVCKVLKNFVFDDLILSGLNKSFLYQMLNDDVIGLQISPVIYTRGSRTVMFEQKKYELYPIYTGQNHPRYDVNPLSQNQEFYLDERLGFVLTTQNKTSETQTLHGAVSFCVCEGGKTLKVIQIQKVKGSEINERMISKADLAQSCIQICYKIALQAGCIFLVVQSAQNNTWIKVPHYGQKTPSIQENQLLGWYDKPVKKIGFSSDSNNIEVESGKFFVDRDGNYRIKI